MQSQMLSVLIVDDEVPIREELRLVNWASHGAVLVGEAENGQDALDFCTDFVPDVVITDITMPKMDGIQLAHMLKSQFPEVQIIMLTAYSDFRYAKEAIKLGALDYLVKVLWSEEELASVLNKAREIIIREQLHKKNSREQLRFQQSNLFNQYLHAGSLTTNQFIAEMESAGILLSFPYRMAKLVVRVALEDILFLDRALQKLLSELEQLQNERFIWLPSKPGEYYLFLNNPSNDLSILSKQLEDIRSFLQNGILQHVSYISSEVDLFVLISHSFLEEKEILSRLKEMNYSAHYGFYENQQKVGVIDQFAYHSLNNEKTREIEKGMKAFLYNREKLTDFLQRDFYDWCTKNRFRPDEIKGLVAKWRMEWMKEVKGVAEVEVSQELAEATSLSQVIHVLTKELNTNENIEYKHRFEIRKAIDIIENKLGEQLTLSSVSEEVGLSPNYLSRLFREETGKSFNEFMTDLRMVKAIHLLKHSNLKVYEVAEKIGIPSYRYFSVLFRKWTGLTPKDFRKR
ncbi:hypothetical protein WQ54_21930 [Bacillus sp. SA1-12]|uniref:response regulator n=1 Tax=Bacillus sp. SA1-12 TaxID=1455638 RepID=UPI0006270C67|nr:response regulator [Bacillus sp. SA1-12]KKI90584.1 hypothetical protein WQ54_21930 [Bacillus sp. SA1-12]